MSSDEYHDAELETLKSRLAAGRPVSALLQALTGLPDTPVRELRDAIGELTTHPDPDVRIESLTVLAVRWKDAYSKLSVTRALLHDDDVAVRETAAFGLAALSSEATRESDVATLVGITKSDEEPVVVRRAAYEGLLIIHRRRDFPLGDGFDPSVDVDWAWLRSISE